VINYSKNIKKYNNIIKNRHSFRWFAFIFGLVAYAFVNFHRVSLTVLAPSLLETFKISSTNLGFMSSIYFYCYSPMQPICGALTDQWRPRKMFMVFIFIMTLGLLLFAYSPSFLFTYIGRLLIGIGSAGVYVPVSWIISKYFSYNKRGFLFSIFMLFGNLGSILATSPFARLVNLFGWRIALTKISFFSFLLLVFVWALVKDNNFNNTGQKHINNKDIMKENERKVSWFVICKKLLSMPIIKYCFFSSISYGAMISLQGLWAIPFLVDIYKMDKYNASNFLIMIPIGIILGLLTLSKLNDSKFGKYVYFWVHISSTAVYLVFTIFTNKIPSILILILFFLLGFQYGSVPFLLKMYTLILPKRHYGTALGIVNVFPFLLAALYLSLTGLLFDCFGGGEGVLNRSLESYKIYFLFLSLSLAISSLASLKIIEILNKDYKSIK